MRAASRLLPRLWPVVPAAALAFLACVGVSRARRVDYLCGLEGRAAPAGPGERSPTGLAGGERNLIVPGRNEASFHWIAQTQQMLASGEARVRRADYENAPFGVEVAATSPYRWWLGALAWADHAVSDRPVGLSVERAAIVADPILHALLVLGAALVAARAFGGPAAAVVAALLACSYPLAAEFSPAMPDSTGLGQVLAFAAILPLLAAMAPGGEGRRRLGFAAAGVAGGLGMWVGVSTQVPVTAGLVCGGLAAAALSRRKGEGAGGAPPPWRAWSLAGAVTVLAAYLLEYAPGYLGTWRLAHVHPAYGLAWVGAGELLQRAARGRAGARRPGILLAGAAAALAALPAAILLLGGPGFLGRDLSWAHVGGLPDAPLAANLRAWLAGDGASAASVATLLPLCLLACAAWLAVRRQTGPEWRACLALGLGPALVALAFACRELIWWGALDVALAALAAPAMAVAWRAGPLDGRWLCACAAASCVAAGAARGYPWGARGPAAPIGPRESEELVVRHLAHWLAGRSGAPGEVVYAPPDETTLLWFFGGLRGVGTFGPDNRDGFAASLAMAGARSMEEEQGQIQGRGVRYVVIPSWDPFFEDFARLYLAGPQAGRQSLFARELRSLELPPWLRPIPYQLPVGGGFEGQSVLVFEVVEDQGPAVAASRVAEYLVETGDGGRAAAQLETLRRYPGDVGALAARAQVLAALGDSGAFGRTVDALLARLSVGADRYLPWDRRVSLAIVLARAHRYEMARDQVGRCLQGVSDERLRSLSTGSLNALLVLTKAFGLEIADPALRRLAADLLPEDLRSRL